MNTRYFLCTLVAFLPLLYGLTCPTPTPPPQQKLRAPRFVEAKVVVEKIPNYSFQELIFLSWAAPDSDSARVAEYVIIPHLPFDSAVDTLGIFPDEAQHLPVLPRHVYQFTRDIRNYGLEADMLTLSYQIFAIDSSGVSSDTSLPIIVNLLRTANLLSPADTLRDSAFSWEISQINNHVFTNMMLWNSTDSLPLFTSDTLDDYIEYYNGTRFSTSIPAGLLPLQKGKYIWSVRVVAPSPAPGSISFAIGSFYAP